VCNALRRPIYSYTVTHLSICEYSLYVTAQAIYVRLDCLVLVPGPCRCVSFVSMLQWVLQCCSGCCSVSMTASYTDVCACVSFVSIPYAPTPPPLAEQLFLDFPVSCVCSRMCQCPKRPSRRHQATKTLLSKGNNTTIRDR